MPFESKLLYVGNLPYAYTSRDLQGLIGAMVPISRATVAEKAEGGSRGFGIVQFALEEDREELLRRHKEVPIMVSGRRLILSRYNSDRPSRIGADQRAHPSEYVPAPNSILIYNIPEDRQNKEALFKLVHDVYRYTRSVFIERTKADDWHKVGITTPSVYAIVKFNDPKKHVSKQKDKEPKEQFFSHPYDRIAADVFKRLKKEWGITGKSGVIVRPHDSKACPRATTLIVRNLPFTATADDLWNAVREKYPLLSLRLPGRRFANGNFGGSGFGFLVLATFADAAQMVADAQLQVRKNTCIVDWNLCRDTFEKYQAELLDKKKDMEKERGPECLTDDAKTGTDTEDNKTDSDSESTYASTDLEDDEMRSSNEPSIELYEEGKTVLRVLGKQEEEQDRSRELDESSANTTMEVTDAVSDVDSNEQVIGHVPEITQKDEKEEHQELERTIFVTGLPSYLPSDRMEAAKESLKRKKPDHEPTHQEVISAGFRFELRTLFNVFGAVKNVSLVVDNATGRHTGSAFVLFKSPGSAHAVMEYYNSLKNLALFAKDEGKAPKALTLGKVSDDPLMLNLYGEENLTRDVRESVLKREGIHQEILGRFKVPVRNIDLATGCFVINDSSLTVKPALARKDLKVIQERRKNPSSDDDPRNIRLIRVGLLIPGIDGFKEAKVPPEDVVKRVRYWKKLKQIEKNVAIHINKYRIVIRNIPPLVEEKRICWLVVRSFGKVNESEARSRFDKNDKLYEEKVLMRLLHAVGCTEIRLPRNGKAYNLTRSLDRVYSEDGYLDVAHGRRCFVEFSSHENALRCLLALNNNPRSFEPTCRPICEFAIENAHDRYNHAQREKARAQHRKGKEGATQKQPKKVKEMNKKRVARVKH
ncbi:putative RNA binding protein [Giardia muris]|uniref:Putative RNA binding protein n=1 Tax=Giardia muris TaxID=5742 RepID=A0A4Z1SQ96_GIAMU|nr:putative RNA binding protein [Giardia muris]|eukprot:TNJ28022.1 putative RNA binding protein [Giardia muris]